VKEFGQKRLNEKQRSVLYAPAEKLEPLLDAV